ncbi:MAG TPA: monovalent cation/H(+) antiporter subunit G [Paracoccus sp. (in: a-proteobacteria)]|nr:monovalent cation/H(+) antiporter subunit G [Paracoccus sp. (in: a-proteobacteria)]
MSHLSEIPPFGAVMIAIFLVIGSTLALIGNLGLVRLRTFYERLHAPTLGTSWGTAATVLASMLTFSFLNGRLLVHELAIGIFIMITTPVAFLLLGRAARRRDPGSGAIMSPDGAPTDDTGAGEESRPEDEPQVTPKAR